jgi:hypothetical protein
LAEDTLLHQTSKASVVAQSDHRQITVGAARKRKKQQSCYNLTPTSRKKENNPPDKRKHKQYNVMDFTNPRRSQHINEIIPKKNVLGRVWASGSVLKNVPIFLVLKLSKYY